MPAPNNPDVTVFSKGAKSESRETQAGAIGHVVEADAVPPEDVSSRRSRLGASEPLVGEVTRSQRVRYWSSWPTRAVGKLLFMKGDDPYSCSATSIASETRNAVWTAAHCLHSGTDGSAGFYSDFVFLPAYRDGQIPWGWWFASRVIVTQSWAGGTANDGVESSDMGALVVYSGQDGYGNLMDEVGAWGYRFNGETAFSDVYSYGYPAHGYNRPDTDFANGEFMMFCFGNTEDADDWNPWDDRLRMDCDMGGGSSGGPLAIGVDDNNMQIVGTNSHRVGTQYLYSSNHDDEAAAVINLVNNG